MKQFLHYFKITLSLLMLLQMGELSAQFIHRPATCTGANKSMALSYDAKNLMDGEGKTGLATDGYGPLSGRFYWMQTNNPVTFFITMTAPSTVSSMLLYEPWGLDEDVKNVTLKLYNGTTLLGTENKLIPIDYASRYNVLLSQKYNNVTKAEFIVLDDYNISSVKRTSLHVLVLGDYDCTNFPNQIATGVSKYLCSNVAITPITLATTNATAATVTGLPPGLSGSWSANVFTISGTPTTVGPYTYTVTATGNNCDAATATGTLTVGASAPTLSTTRLENTCPTTVTVNLNSSVSSTAPTGATLVWFTNNTATGTAVTDPTAVTAGTYYAFYTNADKTCYGPASAVVTVTIKNCCDVLPVPTWN
jgi:hypothetical protein